MPQAKRWRRAPQPVAGTVGSHGSHPWIPAAFVAIRNRSRASVNAPHLVALVRAGATFVDG
ncbi:MAG TPA: hypothetical protein VIN00_07025, partial [Candidatus Dormibacteraeota bacterium]